MTLIEEIANQFLIQNKELPMLRKTFELSILRSIPEKITQSLKIIIDEINAITQKIKILIAEQDVIREKIKITRQEIIQKLKARIQRLEKLYTQKSGFWNRLKTLGDKDTREYELRMINKDLLQAKEILELVEKDENINFDHLALPLDEFPENFGLHHQNDEIQKSLDFNNQQIEKLFADFQQQVFLLKNKLRNNKNFYLEKVETALKSLTEKKQLGLEIQTILSEEFFTKIGLTDLAESPPQSENQVDHYLETAAENSAINLRRIMLNFFEYYANQGIQPTILEQKFREHLEQVKGSISVGYHDCSEDGLKIMETGIIKTLFDFQYGTRVSSATGDRDREYRRNIESHMGFRTDSPLCLAMASEFDKFGPAPSFGDIFFSFPWEIFKDKATATVGDSINPASFPHSFQSQQEETENYRQISLEHALIAKALLDLEKELAGDKPQVNFIRALCYIEVQYPGKLRLEQASKITITTSALFRELECFKKFKTFSNFKKFIQEKYPKIIIEVVDNISPELWELHRKNWALEVKAYQRFIES